MKSKEREQLLEEALAIQERSRQGYINAEWIVGEIFKLINEHPDDEIIDMAFEERENHFRKLKELEGRLWVATKDLLQLDKDYRKVAEKVNKSYGMVVMPIEEPLTLKDIVGEDDWPLC